MVVIVETNFILELAMLQGEAEQADAILKLAEAGEIELAIPAAAFLEAHTKLAAQSKKRNVLLNDIRVEIKQMARSHTFADLEQTSKSITDALVSSGELYTTELDKASHRLRASATIIALTRDAVAEASGLDLVFDLKPGDAFIYASLDSFLKERSEGACLFLTRDKDFEQTAFMLEANGCKLILGFGAGLAAIQAGEHAGTQGAGASPAN